MVPKEKSQEALSWPSLAIALVLMAAAARLLPHWPNFTPIGAMALFAGARLRRQSSWLLPLTAMVISDTLLHRLFGVPGFIWMTPVIYGSLTVNVLLGALLRSTTRVLPCAALAVAGSAQFFVLTNFAVWLSSTHLYPHSGAGLLACYVAAVPFFSNSVMGDLAYTTLLFGIHSLASKRAFPAETAPARYNVSQRG